MKLSKIDIVTFLAITLVDLTIVILGVVIALGMTGVIG